MSILACSITVAVYLVLADESSESDNDGTSALPRCRHVGPSRNKSDLVFVCGLLGLPRDKFTPDEPLHSAHRQLSFQYTAVRICHRRKAN